MKKLFLTLIALFTISVVSFSQKEMSESDIAAKEFFLRTKNSLSFTPLNLFNQELQATYERKFGASSAIVILGSFKHNADITQNNIFTVGGELHYRKYLYFTKINVEEAAKKNKESVNSFGFFASPIVGFEHHESRTVVGVNYYDAIQLGFVTGVNYAVFEGKLRFGAYLGFVDKFVTKTNMDKPGSGQELFVFYPNKMGIIPKGNFYVGFTF